MLTFNNYIRAESLDEAYTLCQKKGNVVLGGMHWLKMQRRQVGSVIDLSALGLDTIEETTDAFQIGAMVSLRDAELHAGLEAYTQGALRHALKHIVGVQFRNTATMGGSVFARFGFSDILTVLMALDAGVTLHGKGSMPIGTFADMPYARDLLTHITIPKQKTGVVYLSQRNVQTDIPVLTCAASADAVGYRIVIGARPQRAVYVEDANRLLKNGITEESAKAFADYVQKNTEFGGNMRAGAQYRTRIAGVLTYRALMQLGGIKAWN